ncbi:MAG: DEAD/DEAH box helicase family protein, partial [Chloroflexota bacterium]|nr:DEAD/DEAH box helicase family protein [Chloroflexota bacterium]
MVLELYRSYFPGTRDLLMALGVADDAFRAADYDVTGLLTRVRSDDEFTRRFRFEALRETLALTYPSYILALAMGTGKTVLIGAIFATEFAMSMEYPDGGFVQNALVFAPGKTIIESLRELAGISYGRILPPRFFKSFAASVKITFTKDGEREIPVARRSLYNVIVTNTEKIRIQKPTIRARNITQLQLQEREAQETEIANLRLQAIASLPHLAVFSDEAHHTYGQAMDTELKKVRKTVDYLAQKTNVVCVVNTTGTPYYQRQPLRDVVFWYGLAQGIHDGILKEVAGNIRGFSFGGNVSDYLAYVVTDFFKDYGGVTLPDGTPAKLAIYFPQTDDVATLRPVVEKALADVGLSPAVIIEHHTGHDQKADFDRFKFKDSPHRIALLVDRGVEGWDVPALFSCALARRLTSSNNFVLQAASRCLRQVPGNRHYARIYLSLDNQAILDRQLQETYGETITDLNQARTQTRPVTIVVRKLNLPPLNVRQVIRTVEPREAPSGGIHLHVPDDVTTDPLLQVTFTIAQQAFTRSVLSQMEDALEITTLPKTVDLYMAAVEMAATCRLPVWQVYDELSRLYSTLGQIPTAHLPALAGQIEEQTRGYEVREETVERALALVKLPGFDHSTDASGADIYTAEISYPVDRESLLISWQQYQNTNPHDFGFHYSPYDFDSAPERSFFGQLLAQLNLHPDQVEDIYFTGALTSLEKTDFYVDYRGEDNQWHRYTPDFLIRRKDGRCLI